MHTCCLPVAVPTAGLSFGGCRHNACVSRMTQARQQIAEVRITTPVTSHVTQRVHISPHVSSASSANMRQDNHPITEATTTTAKHKRLLPTMTATASNISRLPDRYASKDLDACKVCNRPFSSRAVRPPSHVHCERQNPSRTLVT